MNLSLDQSYWTSRYKQNQIGWDVGQATTPIKQYLDQVEDKSIRILFPGAGNAYEAIYAWENGFQNIHVLDFSIFPLENFQKQHPDFPNDQIHHQDFFQHEYQYDLILEQTFFCALPVDIRQEYAIKMHDSLKQGGLLVGVMFNRIFEHDGPPFGGTVDEYKSYFEDYFDILTIAPCYNSIPPRAGSEIFIRFRKK
ncbi:thiopurine S-methyltransferase [Belliella buryatensis]|uniref:Thiopurine S-methyltransferase n=1 Tax=Belliella buryatensis TaxID=1500549 RepID=A0A239CYZ5_9BACT|nr:SAM-dependent methyltransferase [Belliella buryatensis]SNS24871.1 thiopurine S-methyltransferase [Belliella buryatensis]